VRSFLQMSALFCLSGALHAASFTVTQTADSSDNCDSACSLREAISDANRTPGNDDIAFSLPGTGPFVLGVSTPLPQITETLTIDGYTQSGARPNDAVVGSNAVLQIELRGSGTAGVGLALCAPNIVVRGLAITGFGAAGLHTALSGPLSCLQSGSNVRVEGNFIGLEADGLSARPNGQGIVVNGGTAHIGGITPAQRNVIAGNSNNGVLYEGAGLAGSSVLGNLIGSDRSGVLDRGNAGAGVRVDAALDISIGGAAANVIAFNAVGVHVATGSQRIDMAHNLIRQNDALGIDLSTGAPNGVTPNDVDDADFGSNSLQNFPELQVVERTATGLRMRGFLDVPVATQNVPYRITTYLSASCDSSGFGEGERVLDASVLNFTQGSGESFEVFIDTPAPAIGSFITSTATGPSGTSEFSACLRLDGVIFRDGYE
jgi:trimeric autotransporter adhesin